MMKEWHVFETGNDQYIYFPDYKQAFGLDEIEVNHIKCMDLEGKNLLEELEEEIDKDFLQDDFEDAKSIYGLYLNVSNTCNACCVYCFAHQGNYGKIDAIMNESTAVGAIDFYMKKVPLTETAAIIFFGGEPLMAFPVIKKLVSTLRNHTAIAR